MQQNSSETFLVTGALGCLGAWTLRHLTESGAQVVSFDISTDRHRLDLLMKPSEQEAITFLEGDLTDTERVRTIFEEREITHVIHLAALQVPFCKADPPAGAHVNVVGTTNVFEAARRAGVGHVAYASSVAVYGPPSTYAPGPIAHDARPAPGTLYGVWKVTNEETARIYWQNHQLSSTALRPYTIYGVGRDQGLTSDPTKAMRAAARGELFEIGFGGTMQFQWASDVARHFIEAARHSLNGAHVFNLGTTSASVAEVIDLITDIEPGAQITHTDENLPFPEVFDGHMLKRHMPDVYETPLAEGIRQTIEHFRGEDYPHKKRS